MRKPGKRRLQSRSGATLVEMVVTLLLFGIMMSMVVAVVSPASKLFLRMQRLQRAQVILDNTIYELQAIAEQATEYVKIYSAGGDTTGAGGTGSGPMAEFVSPEGYVTLVSAEGCPPTHILMGGTDVETVDGVDEGRLLVRYYSRDISADPSLGASYQYKKDGTEAARAVARPFADGYYMGNYLKIEFSFPGGIAEGAAVDYVNAKVELYSDEERTQLVVWEDVVLELRYAAERVDAVTAGG